MQVWWVNYGSRWLLFCVLVLKFYFYSLLNGSYINVFKVAILKDSWEKQKTAKQHDSKMLLRKHYLVCSAKKLLRLIL